MFNWMKDANDFLKDQEPAAGDPETLEAQLDQSEVSWFTHLTPHSSSNAKRYHQLLSSPYHIHTLSTTEVRVGNLRPFFKAFSLIPLEVTVKAFYSQTLAFFSAFLKRGMEVTTCLDGQLLKTLQ